MRHLRAFALLLATMCGLLSCEVYTLTPDNPTGRKHPGFTANNSESAVYLFSAELQQGNYYAAVSMLMPDENASDARAKMDLVPTVKRLSNVLGNKPITNVEIDTISPTHHAVLTYYDYYKTIEFSTRKFNDTWFISEFSGLQPLTSPTVINVE